MLRKVTFFCRLELPVANISLYDRTSVANHRFEKPAFGVLRDQIHRSAAAWFRLVPLATLGVQRGPRKGIHQTGTKGASKGFTDTRGFTDSEVAGRAEAKPATAIGSGRVGVLNLMARIESKNVSTGENVSMWPRVRVSLRKNTLGKILWFGPDFFSSICSRPTSNG